MFCTLYLADMYNWSSCVILFVFLFTALALDNKCDFISGCWWMSVIVHCCCCFCKTPAFDDEENDPGKITTTHLPQPHPQLEYIINSTTTTHPISPQPIIPPTLICGLILPLHPPNLNVNPSPFLTWWGIGNCYHRNLEFVLIFLGRNDT